MAHFATKRFNYWSQLAILMGFVGGGMIIGGIASILPLLGKISLSDLGTGDKLMAKLLVPENATALRWMQFISTLFLFFLPTVFYAWLCHKRTFTHLGFQKSLTIQQVGLILLIVLASSPLVAVLQDLTEMLPFSKATFQHFKEAEEAYFKQVTVIGRMNGFGDYIISMIMIAFLPAVFEETLFRGGIQNLFTRWFKMPIVAIIVTSIVFSAIHGSYLGFLSRFALSFVLGWVYYRTGNIWLNIIAHFINNAIAVTALYITTRHGEKLDPSKLEDHFPLWAGAVSLAAVYGLFVLFEKISKEKIDRPGEEVIIPGYENINNPFLADVPHHGEEQSTL